MGRDKGTSRKTRLEVFWEVRPEKIMAWRKSR